MEAHKYYFELAHGSLQWVADEYFSYPERDHLAYSKFSRDWQNGEKKITEKFRRKNRADFSRASSEILQDIKLTGLIKKYEWTELEELKCDIACYSFCTKEEPHYRRYVSINSELFQHTTAIDFSNIFIEELMNFANDSQFMPHTYSLWKFRQKYFSEKQWSKILVDAYFHKTAFYFEIRNVTLKSLDELTSFVKLVDMHGVRFRDDSHGNHLHPDDIWMFLFHTYDSLKGGVMNYYGHGLDWKMERVFEFGKGLLKLTQEVNEKLLSNTKDILALIGREAA